jgi:carbon-monoxide dehydrogenase medium subunit
MRARRAADSLVGAAPSPKAFDAAGALAAEEVAPETDALASAEYRRAMTRVITRRALQTALARVTSGRAP